jgi:hypothetical protein
LFHSIFQVSGFIWSLQQQALYLLSSAVDACGKEAVARFHVMQRGLRPQLSLRLAAGLGTDNFIDEQASSGVRPLVDAPTLYSSPEAGPDMVGMARNICPLGHLVRQTH